MRIAINTLYLLPGRVGGTEIYIRNLLQALLSMDKENEYIIFINRESVGLFDDIANPRTRIISRPVQATYRSLRVLWEQLILPFQIRHHGIDLLLSAGNTTPFFCRSVNMVIIHDLQHINQPWNFPWYWRIPLGIITRLSALSADCIITVSDSVRKDLEKYYRLSSDRIYVFYNGIDETLFYPRRKEEILEVKRRYNLPDRFIFYPAASLPHKNHSRLLEAFKQVKAQTGDLKLILTGARDYGYETIEAKIRELGLNEDVISLGWLPYRDVALIYCATQALVFPSLHEGFGMPVIEAMASGVPVVCSNIPPLREIAGDAALLVDPYNTSEIVKALLSVLDDSSLRDSLIRKGLERAKLFSWKNTARGILKLFDSFKGDGS